MIPEEMKDRFQRPKGVFHTSQNTEDGVVLGQHSIMQPNVQWPGGVVDQSEAVKCSVHCA